MEESEGEAADICAIKVAGPGGDDCLKIWSEEAVATHDDSNQQRNPPAETAVTTQQ
jgi:hypothetical protein